MKTKKRCQGPAHCPECPFKSRTVGSRGPVDAKIVIVGESPGATEVKLGQPFIGPSGALLRAMLAEVGIDEREVYITNAFKCLPPRSRDEYGNRVKDGVLNDAARACHDNLIEELSAYPRDLIITMGSASSRSLSEVWGMSITKARGQMLDSALATYGVLPTLHPAYILRNPAATPQLRTDLLKAKHLLSGGTYPKPTVKYIVLETKRQIDQFIYKHIITPNPEARRWQLVSDIEGTGLDRYADKFRCIAFAPIHSLKPNGENTAYIVTGAENGELVKHLFRAMPAYVEWVWHNGKFDTSFLRAKGIPREQCRVDHDTMLLSYSLDETGGRHSLEQCLVDHLNLPAYKDEINANVGKKKKWKTFADVPTSALHPRAAKDTIYTGLLFKKLYKDVCDPKRPHMLQAYKDLLIPASNALATIELNGMPINQAVLRKAEYKLQQESIPILTKLRSIVGDKSFNPNSHVQVMDILRQRYKLRVQSSSEDIIKKYEKDFPFIKTLLEYRDFQKMIGTYLTSFRKYGSRVHTSYLIHGTVTGRLSSSSPNMQNIPKEDLVRSHFRTKEGRIFVSFDYSQAELRSLAVLSGDKVLIDIFKSGKDMHHAVAAQVYGNTFTSLAKVLPDGSKNPVYEEYRRRAKTINFGIVYGATERTLMERLGISWDEAHALIEGWFEMFPDAKRFMRACRKNPLEGRPLITVFGRQRRFYVVTTRNRHSQENEAGNFPHQSMCSDFTLAAAIEIDKLHARGRLPGNAQQVNIIHDDNMFEIDDNPEAINELIRIVKPIMENVPVKHGITELTFKSEASKGYIWSKMEELK